MAHRIKTVEYWFPYLASAADNTSTAFSQITVYLPEATTTGFLFHSVVADIVIEDKQTTATSLTARELSLTLQGAAASTVNTTIGLTNSGENIVHHWSQDYTSYFTSNWGANTSRTLDASVRVDTSALGSGNASLRVTITYRYDDSATTQLKTVWIPLDSVATALPTTKTTADTIPVLNTYLPEASKTFRQIVVVTQGNQEAVTTTDISRSFDVDSIGTITALYEKGLATSSWYRLNQVYTFDTSVTHTFSSWASVTDFDHPQNYLVVTYEYNEASTTSMMVSLLLPATVDGNFGGTTAGEMQRVSTTLNVQEGSPVLQRLAALVQYGTSGACPVSARVGTGSYVSYSSVATVPAGSNAFMVRNDAAFSISRGSNTFTLDVYRNNVGVMCFGGSVMWLVNYTCTKPSGGTSTANHTILRNLKVVGTGNANRDDRLSAIDPSIPETNYFLNSVGIQLFSTSTTVDTQAGVHVGARNDADTAWLDACQQIHQRLPEVGVTLTVANSEGLFHRWRDDVGPNRMALTTARKWRIVQAHRAFTTFGLVFTYHTISYTVSGTVSGSGGGTVNLDLVRDSDDSILLSSSRVGNGAYSFTWYDDTENVHVVAYEDGSHVGRSDSDLAV